MKSHRVTLKITYTQKKKNRSILSYLAKKIKPKMTPELVIKLIHIPPLPKNNKIKIILIIHPKNVSPISTYYKKKTMFHF
jgi:hypothetical protein